MAPGAGPGRNSGWPRCGIKVEMPWVLISGTLILMLRRDRNRSEEGVRYHRNVLQRKKETETDRKESPAPSLSNSLKKQGEAADKCRVGTASPSQGDTQHSTCPLDSAMQHSRSLLCIIWGHQC